MENRIKGTPPIHVMPISDIREHEDSRECWCVPVLDHTPVSGEAEVWVHNAFAEGYGDERKLE